MTQAKLTKTHRWDPKLFARVEELARNTARPVQHVLDEALGAGLARLELDNYQMRDLVRSVANLVYQDQMVSNQAAYADRDSHRTAHTWLKERELDTAVVKLWPEVKVLLAHRRNDDPAWVEAVVSHDWGGNRDDWYALTGNRVLVINAYDEVFGWQLRDGEGVPEIAGYEEMEF